ncbi:MAG: MMPL family transporter [Pseudomonadales bacterium]
MAEEPASQSMLSGLMLLGMRRPWRVIVVSVVAAALFGAGMGGLSFNPEYRAYFDDDDERLLAFDHVRGEFNPNDSVTFLMVPADDDAFSRDSLEILRALTAEAWKLPFATRVDSITNFQHVIANGDDVLVTTLVPEEGEIGPEHARLAKVVALAEPALMPALVARAGEVAAVNVTVIHDEDPLAASNLIMHAAQALVREFEQRYPGTRLHLGGIVAMNHGFSNASQSDVALLVPLMLGVFVGVLWLTLRRLVPTVAVVIVVAVALCATIGAAGWWQLRLTSVTVTAPIIITTVGIAACIHVLMTYMRLRTRMPRPEALEGSLSENWRPVWLTTVTTVVGFLAMNSSEVPPFRELGNIVALGVLICGALAVWLLPALVTVLPDSAGRRPWIRLEFIAGFLERRRSAIIVVGVLVAALAPFGVLRNEINDAFVDYFDPSLPFRQAADLSGDHLGGLYQIEYQLTSLAPGGVHDPAYVREVDALANWLRGHEDVRYVASWSDILRRVHRTLSPDEGEALPQSAELAAQYLLLLELSLPMGLDVTNFVDLDRSSSRMVVALGNQNSRRMLELEEEFSSWIDSRFEYISEQHGGINLMFSHVGVHNVQSMLRGTVLAVIFMGLVLGLTLRSVRLGVVSLLTNLVPIAGAFAIWGFAVGEVGLSLTAAVPMTLGIVVDDTVHFLCRHQAGRAEGMAVLDAAEGALLSVGPALTATTLVLCLGFLVLASSSFTPNAHMGQITALTLVLALVFDLLVLPALLTVLGPRTAK